MKVLHAADLHLDSAFQRLDYQQAMTRRKELRELPRRIVETAVAEQVDLILLPGDLFDGERVYPETIAALSEAFGSTEIPVVIAPGNHDYVRPGSPYLTAAWPENIHIFTDEQPDCLEFPGLNCVVHGYAFTTPHREDEPLRGFAAPHDGKLHLLCVHGEVGLTGRYAPISEADLSRSGAAYAALGHIHAGSGLQWAGDTPWAYPGCPEGRGFDELGEKGVLVVTIGDGGVSARFRALCRRQYRTEFVELDQFDSALGTLPTRDLVRIILTGESQRTPDLAALTAKAAQHCFYAEVVDETTLPQNIWAKMDGDNLTGLFLREMRGILDTAPAEERANILLAVRFGLAALEGGEDVCP